MTGTAEGKVTFMKIWRGVAPSERDRTRWSALTPPYAGDGQASTMKNTG